MNVIIETPKASSRKFVFDEQTQQFVVGKTLPPGMAFPFNFGFVPGTLGEDGDPLDVIVLAETALETGHRLDVRIVGCLPALQTKKGKTYRNDRYIGVPETSTAYEGLVDVAQLPNVHLDDIRQFFVQYLKAEGQQLQFLPVLSAGDAIQLIELNRR